MQFRIRGTTTNFCLESALSSACGAPRLASTALRTIGSQISAAIVLAGAVAGLVAIPAALIVFRLRGAYFAIGTWVVAEVCRLILAQVKQLGGGTGMSLPPDIASSIVGLDFVRGLFAVRGPAARDIMVYWLALILAIGTFVRRFPAVELATDQPEWNGRIVLRGLANLPLRIGS